MKVFLGIDGGGTKTEFLLIDETGRVLANRHEGSAYYIEIGMEALRRMLVATVRDLLASVSLQPEDLSFAFVGLPAYGESSELLSQLDNILENLLPKSRYRCANDVVCAWAGGLGGEEGIALVAGTGSIAYGEFAARSARSGGWGELFGDEGSAYWLAAQALTVFSRMSDGRTSRGPLYELMRRHFRIREDLEVCAKVYGPPALSRSELAGLARLVTEAANEGDHSAQRIVESAARELAALVHAVRDSLGIAPQIPVPTSYCGGLLQKESPLLPLFEQALTAGFRAYELRPPRMSPAAGAAVTAARLGCMPLDSSALGRLERVPTAENPH